MLSKENEALVAELLGAPAADPLRDPVMKEARSELVTMISQTADDMKEPLISEIVELTWADIDIPQANKNHTVARLRASHHEIARLTAMGLKGTEIARRLGYHPMTISLLKRSPAFNRLVHFFMSERDAAAMDVRQRMLGMAADGLEAIHEQMHNGKMDAEQLESVTFKLLDRAGHGPSQKVESFNYNLSAADILELKTKVREAEAKVIDSSATRVA